VQSRAAGSAQIMWYERRDAMDEESRQETLHASRDDLRIGMPVRIFAR
jgi:hypothetical protein